jgi:hypothetical protein
MAPNDTALNPYRAPAYSAMRPQGIRKQSLRYWRAYFALHLAVIGVTWLAVMADREPATFDERLATVLFYLAIGGLVQLYVSPIVIFACCVRATADYRFLIAALVESLLAAAHLFVFIPAVQ